MNILVKLTKKILKKFGITVLRNSTMAQLDFHHYPIYDVASAPAHGDDVGTVELRANVINQTIPFLNSLSSFITQKKYNWIEIKNFPNLESGLENVELLKKYLDHFGSDKGNAHDYHKLYGVLFSDRNAVKKVLEIGLGTNNTDTPSNMGADGKPGASLRAFKEYFSNADIYGADIDKRILFEEERIQTYYVDQTDPETFESLNNLPSEFDLIIDDGLHAVNANIQTLLFGLQKIKAGGWVVIEDIPKAAEPLWEVVSALLPPEVYLTYRIRASLGHLFVVQRLK